MNTLCQSDNNKPQWHCQFHDIEGGKGDTGDGSDADGSKLGSDGSGTGTGLGSEAGTGLGSESQSKAASSGKRPPKATFKQVHLKLLVNQITYWWCS